MKKCSKCKKDRELSEFGRDSTKQDKKNVWCKKCCNDSQALRKEEKQAYDKEYREKNRDKLCQQDRERHQKDPEKARLYKLLTKFGLTAEEEQRMLEAQNHVCAICKKPEWVKFRGKVKRLAVDHCRKTGKVRRLLCNNCNRAFGMLYEDPAIILALYEYSVEWITK